MSVVAHFLFSIFPKTLKLKSFLSNTKAHPKDTIRARLNKHLKT